MATSSNGSNNTSNSFTNLYNNLINSWQETKIWQSFNNRGDFLHQRPPQKSFLHDKHDVSFCMYYFQKKQTSSLFPHVKLFSSLSLFVCVGIFTSNVEWDEALRTLLALISLGQLINFMSGKTKRKMLVKSLTSK